MPKKFQLHPSAMNMCPEAFRRKYIEGERTGSYTYHVRGKAVDAGVSADMMEKLDVEELLPEDTVLDITRDATLAEWQRGVDLEPEEAAKGVQTVKGELVDQAVRLERLHHREVAPLVKPVSIQKSWVLTIDGLPLQLAGRMDLEDTEGVRDTKTSGKTPPKDVADKSLQLTAYALAKKHDAKGNGEYPKRLVLDYLIDTKSLQAKSYPTVRSDADAVVLLNRVEMFGRMIQSGLFPPISQDDWRCSEKYCPFAKTCKYYRRPVSIWM